MHRHLLAFLLSWLCLFISSRIRAGESQSFVVLNYHDVQDYIRPFDDATTITTDTLVLHLNWLRKHGYNVVGMDDVIAAKEGKKALPPQAVMLTFDDGYESFYTRVFPLLKSFKLKAVQAVVGHWIDRGQECQGQGVSQQCKNGKIPFMTWEQLQEIKESGLVEIASHTYHLHQGIAGNPQSDKLPAATTLHYNEHTKSYENLEQYKARIKNDLVHNNQMIQKNLGITPRVIVWPYGSHHSESVAVSKEAGMAYSMLLGDHATNTLDKIDMIGRFLIYNGTPLEDLVAVLKGRMPVFERVVRAMHIDLDYLYDPDPAQMKRNLDRLIDRVEKMGANSVYLQAFSDTDGDGAADSLYFPNRYLPMRADLFGHVAWRLKKRLRVRVYAWMPVMAFHMPEKYSVPLVEAISPEKKGAYHRLSPFNEKSRKLVKDLYEDLSMHARFAGILFHDDATLNDYEDSSASAHAVYRSWGLNSSIEALRANAAERQIWSKAKTEYINRWTLELAETAQRFQDHGLLTARNIYARPVIDPAAEEWFAQSLESFLRHYDYTVIMAMPYMEEVPLKDHETWLAGLVATVAAHPNALDRTVFELQAVDWKTKQHIADEVLARHLFVLHQNAALNLAYYPDDFPANRPNIGVLRRHFAWVR